MGRTDPTSQPQWQAYDPSLVNCHVSHYVYSDGLCNQAWACDSGWAAEVSPGSFDGTLGQEIVTFCVVKLIGPRSGAASDHVGTSEGGHAWR